jgi:hypothetical protein
LAELAFFSGTMDCGKSTLALQIRHNRSARGLVGMIFTRNDRAGEGRLSSRLGLVTDAVEADETFDFHAHLVRHLTAGGRVDYVIADEAQFLSAEQVDQLARVVDDLGIDVYAFGITTDFRTRLFPGSQRLRGARPRGGGGGGGGPPPPPPTPARWAGGWSSRARRSSSATSGPTAARSGTRCCAGATTAGG